MNTFHWDTRSKADDFEGSRMWWGTLQGPKAPREFTVQKLISEHGDAVDSADVNFGILMDPRTEGAIEDRQAQFSFLLEIRHKLDETTMP